MNLLEAGLIDERHGRAVSVKLSSASIDVSQTFLLGRARRKRRVPHVS